MPEQAATAPVASTPNPTPETAPAPAPVPAADPADDFAKAVALVKGEAELDADEGAPPSEPAEEPAPAAPEPKTEPKPEAKADEKPPETPLEKTWARLGEAEKRHRVEAQKLKEERAQFAKEREELAALKRAAEEDPFALVERKFGKDWFELAAQRTLNNGKPGAAEGATVAKSEVEQVREEMNRLRSELAAKEQQAEADKYIGTLNTALASDQFEFARAMPRALDEARVYAAGHYQEHGELLSPSDVLGTIQSALEEDFRALAATRRGQEIIASLNLGSAPTSQQKNSQQPSAGKTLTNRLAQRTPQASEDDDDIDDDERIIRAAKLVKFGP